MTQVYFFFIYFNFQYHFKPLDIPDEDHSTLKFMGYKMKSKSIQNRCSPRAYSNTYSLVQTDINQTTAQQRHTDNNVH